MSLKTRLNSLANSFSDFHTHRVVNREYKDLGHCEQDDLETGIFSFFLKDESDFRDTLTTRAKNSSVQLFLACRQYVEDCESASEIEDAEIDMRDEIIAYLRSGQLPAQVGHLQIVDMTFSSQNEPPYAWLLVEFELTE